MTDVNGNGYIDGGDLLRDVRWANDLDEDSNGKFDDLIGWDSDDHDNDPQATSDTHGTGQALKIGAIANNGVGTAGINWALRLMPVRIRSVGSDLVNAKAAAGLDYAVSSGAPISNNSWRAAGRGYTYSQELYDAISRARLAGPLFIAAAGNEGTDNDVAPMSTVEPLSSLAGLCVTGGRVNAAMALSTTSISISDPTITEGNSGTSQLVFAVTRVGDSSGTVALNWSTANGTATAGADYVAASGQVTFLPSAANTQTITVSVNGDLTPEATETLFVRPALVSGNATLADEDAQGLILDHDTKFYVVDDASPDRTSEYANGGGAVESYALNSGNTAPRGAASSVAGDKVSVVDANKKVYVYNPAGGLLGSGTAGGLPANATVEGIATNGTDVWIVDSRSDKVFRYANAAGRLTGSQSAAGNFRLASDNTNPKGIVTDGVSFWVVGDGTANKVFKYTLTGTLLGSWTLDAANASPTGITLDPADVRHLWVVDSGTDRVYQYDSAAGCTSGSQTASLSFALAAGNTNPQDIADPPAPTSAWETPAARPVPPGADRGGSILWQELDAAGRGWPPDPTAWYDGGFAAPGDQGTKGRTDLPAVSPQEIGRFHDRDQEADGTPALLPASDVRQASEGDAPWADMAAGLDRVDVPIGATARLVDRHRR